MRDIVKQGGISGLYRGLGWSVAGIFPEAALCYGMHDMLKHHHTRVCGGEEPAVVHSLLYGVASAFAGQLVAFPLETVSRRLQVQSGNLAAVMQSIAAEGGPRALYRWVCFGEKGWVCGCGKVLLSIADDFPFNSAAERWDCLEIERKDTEE
jgi:hypothetical protein